MAGPEVTKRIALSNSRIDLHRCPYYFREKVLRKITTLNGQEAERGIWVHSYLQEYVNHLLNTGQKADSEFAETLFDQMWFERPMVPELKKELWNLSVGYARSTEFDVEQIVDAELAIDLDWDLNLVPKEKRDEIFFRARIDLLSFDSTQGVAIVEDYKSSWRIIPEGELKEDLQAQIYAWAIFHIYEWVHTVKVKFRFIRHRKSTQVVFIRDEVSYVERTMREISNQIEARMAQGIDNDAAWPPEPGDVCNYCPIRCPLAQKLEATDQVIQDASHARRIAEGYVALDRAYDKYQKLLKAWIDVHGPILVNDKIVGYFPECKRSYDSKTIVDTLMGNQYDVTGLYSVTAASMEEFIKEHPETFDLFKNNMTEKAQTKFAIGDIQEVITDIAKQPKTKKGKKKGENNHADIQSQSEPIS
jgi:hypothetical protein